MNQRQNRQAVIAMVITAMPTHQPRRSWLHDPKALTKVRRKVERATEAAREVLERHLTDRTEQVLAEFDGCAVYPRDFSPCYPDSVGIDTQCRVMPRNAVMTAAEAAALAQGQTVHKVLGAAPVKRKILDRAKVVHAMDEARQRVPASFDSNAWLREQEEKAKAAGKVGVRVVHV